MGAKLRKECIEYRMGTPPAVKQQQRRALSHGFIIDVYAIILEKHSLIEKVVAFVARSAEELIGVLFGLYIASRTTQVEIHSYRSVEGIELTYVEIRVLETLLHEDTPYRKGHIRTAT